MLAEAALFWGDVMVPVTYLSPLGLVRERRVP